MDIKIKILSEEHSRKVQDYLFALDYEWWFSGAKTYYTDELNAITACGDRDGRKFIYKCYNFDCCANQEVELVTEVTDGKVCTYLKEVEPPLKKWEFKVVTNTFGNLVLGAVDADSGKLKANFINLNNMGICGYAKNILEREYDVSGYEWDWDGSIKIN